MARTADACLTEKALRTTTEAVDEFLMMRDKVGTSVRSLNAAATARGTARWRPRSDARAARNLRVRRRRTRS